MNSEVPAEVEGGSVYKRVAPKLARTALAGLTTLTLLFAPSGSFDMSERPERPLQECWDSIGRFAVAGVETPEVQIPESLRAVDSQQPPVPERSPDAGSAAFQLDVRKIVRSSSPETNASIGNFEFTESFELFGGITVNVERDAALPVYPEVVNQIFETTLNAEYDDPNIQAHMWCFKRDLERGLFEGKIINWRVPAYAQVCYSWGLLRVKNEDGDCNSNGVTRPNFSFYGLESDTVSITTTAGAVPGASDISVDRRISRSIAHEFVYHLYYSLLSTPMLLTRLGLDFEEQIAKQGLDPYLNKILASDGDWSRPVEFARN